MSLTSASAPPMGDLVPTLQALTQWRTAATIGQPVLMPAPIGQAVLELAIAALVVHRLVPNPQLDTPATALHDAVAANRATEQWAQGRRLFAGVVHA